ncbi:hypothetical protein C8R47DRAFT_1150213 [Mycena vitilis]|nr:hypothetical protein C8R47DRAFT_1150213 [Mycena vitilis]
MNQTFGEPHSAKFPSICRNQHEPNIWGTSLGEIPINLQKPTRTKHLGNLTLLNSHQSAETNTNQTLGAQSTFWRLPSFFAIFRRREGCAPPRPCCWGTLGLGHRGQRPQNPRAWSTASRGNSGYVLRPAGYPRALMGQDCSDLSRVGQFVACYHCTSAREARCQPTGVVTGHSPRPEKLRLCIFFGLAGLRYSMIYMQDVLNGTH